MSGKPSVFATFAREAPRHFQFLIDEYGFTSEGYREFLLPAVHYHRFGLRCWVILEHGDGAGIRVILTSVGLERDRVNQKAELSRLVEAAVFAPFHRVAWKAHTVPFLQSTLADNATWLRRLLPLLLGPHASDLVARAQLPSVTERLKPRPKNVRWKYG